MRAARPRPAIPALAPMLENSTDHACQTGKPTGLAYLPLPQALLSFSIINGNGYHSQDQPHRHYPSNRHRAPLQLGAPPSATSCIAGLPTPADAACGCGPPRPASANLYKSGHRAVDVATNQIPPKADEIAAAQSFRREHPHLIPMIPGIPKGTVQYPALRRSLHQQGWQASEASWAYYSLIPRWLA